MAAAKAKAGKGVNIPKSRSKKANENWMPTERDRLATQFAVGMIDSRWSEVRRKADHQKVMQRAYELADAQIDYSQGNA